MTVGFVFLICFVFLVVWRKMELRILPPIVFATIFSPLLAAIASFGVISWLRLPIYSMMCVTPFLILGIGMLIFIIFFELNLRFLVFETVVF